MDCVCARCLAEVEYDLVPLGVDDLASSFMTWGAFSWAFTSRFRTFTKLLAIILVMTITSVPLAQVYLARFQVRLHL
jgi:hypothetical protein